MKAEKKSFISWVKKHRKVLILSGIGIAALIATIIGIKNHEVLHKLFGELKASINVSGKSTQAVSGKDQSKIIEVIGNSVCEEQKDIFAKSVNVPMHIRNLHPGWNASEAKIAEAEALDIFLLPGQTIVDPYTKVVA